MLKSISVQHISNTNQPVHLMTSAIIGASICLQLSYSRGITLLNRAA